MTIVPAIHDTFVITRTYPQSPALVFAAFADPAKKRRWFAETKTSELLHYELDFRLDGHEQSRLRLTQGPVAGMVMTNRTVYLELATNARIVFAYTMSLDDRRISASLVTIELLPTGTGTELVFTEQGAFLEGSDGAAMREAGWAKILEGINTVL